MESGGWLGGWLKKKITEGKSAPLLAGRDAAPLCRLLTDEPLEARALLLGGAERHEVAEVGVLVEALEVLALVVPGERLEAPVLVVLPAPALGGVLLHEERQELVEGERWARGTSPRASSPRSW